MPTLEEQLTTLEARRALLLKAQRTKDALDWLQSFAQSISPANFSVTATTTLGANHPGKSEALKLIAEVIAANGPALLASTISNAQAIIAQAEQ